MKKNVNKNLLTTIFYLLIICGELNATNVHPQAGTTSATFLKLPVGAQGSALQAFIASAENVSGICWNPAGVALLISQEGPSQQVEYSHTEHFQDIKHEFFGYIYPAKHYVLGCSILGLYTNNIEARTKGLDFDEEYVNKYQITLPEYYFGVYDIALQITGSKKFKETIFVGSNIKFIQQRIENIVGYGVGIDLGILYIPEKFNFIQLAFVVKNVGPKIKFYEKSYPLPSEAGLGTKVKLNKINFLLDINQPIDDYLSISSGVEWWIKEYLSFRSGYKYRIYGWELAEYAGVSAGVGVNYYGSKLDYSLTSYGVLGLVHKISIGIDFVKIGNLYKLFRQKFGPLFGKQKIQQEINNKEKTKVQEVLNSIILQPPEPKSEFEDLVKIPTSVYVFNGNVELLNIDVNNNIYNYRIYVSSTTNEQIVQQTGIVYMKGEIVTRRNIMDMKQVNVLVAVSLDKEMDETTAEEQIVNKITVFPIFNSELTNCELVYNVTLDKIPQQVKFYSSYNNYEQEIFSEKVDENVYKLVIPKLQKLVVKIK